MEARIDYSKGARTKLSLISQRLTRTIIGYSDCNSLGVGEDYWFDRSFIPHHQCQDWQSLGTCLAGGQHFPWPGGQRASGRGVRGWELGLSTSLLVQPMNPL